MTGLDLPRALPVLVGVLFAGGALESLLPWAPHRGGPRGLALWRAAVITLAVIASYPALFDLRAAPPVHALLTGHPLPTALAHLVPWLLAVGVALLPLGVRERALAEAVQGLTATAALFALFVAYLGATAARLWPGWPGGVLVVVAAASMVALVESGRSAGAPRNAWRSGLALAALAPVLLLYGLALGRQIAVG